MVERPDSLRETIATRAETLGLSAYAIGLASDIDPGTVKRYLTGRCSLNSRYVSVICELLQLELLPVVSRKMTKPAKGNAVRRTNKQNSMAK
jgi:hypothetical protein